MVRSRRALCISAAVLLFAGCDRGEKGEKIVPHLRSTGVYENAFRIGRRVSSDGSATDETNIFHQGDAIYTSFRVENAPKGAKARAVWTNVTRGNAPVAEEDKELGKDGFVSFRVADTSSWEPGDYRLVKNLLADPSNPKAVTNLGTMDVKLLPRR